MIDAIFGHSVTFFEELIFNADPQKDLHLMLDTPGGDGETAIRIIRSAQAHCKQLTIVIPDSAKSAGTLLAMGAHHILMGPTSDLGPVDPQMQVKGELVGCNDIINAVDRAMQDVQANPDTYTLHSALLSDISAVMVQSARSAIDRTDELMEEALSGQPDREKHEVDQLKSNLKPLLVEQAKSHAAVFGADSAAKAGLPVIKVHPQRHQWELVWRLWTKYFALGPATTVYESDRASHVMRHNQD